MLLLGLTGSIATGKSTVSNILRSPPYNLPIIDADVCARKVVEPGTPGYNAIVAHFLPTTPDLLLPASDPACKGLEGGPTGKGRPLNRPALGRRVFGSGEDTMRDRKVLNSIVHPAVRREMYKEMLWAYLRGCWAVVLDIPLLFESGWERYCGTIMVVAVSEPEIQMQRLRDRDPHLSEEDARNRVLSQVDVREKAQRVMRRGEGNGVVVWNDGDRAQLEKEITRVMAEVQKRSPKWWAWLMLLCPPLAGAMGFWSWWRMRKVQLAWEGEKRQEKAKL
ncbi:dephospho-CoA kinase [Saccharata proteae CBS 121410]|uniref:Dephospho-CoA kinase n=1 Tax=Saccharata proteae CBS 121410 TaxID=1314787 RepID=A0A9P4HXI0_9PEZI|nr:dephospho-CoA kinase [Saccharata proteae CBS 121410]